jgi:hypothetical protein
MQPSDEVFKIYSLNVGLSILAGYWDEAEIERELAKRKALRKSQGVWSKHDADVKQVPRLANNKSSALCGCVPRLASSKYFHEHQAHGIYIWIASVQNHERWLRQKQF